MKKFKLPQHKALTTGPILGFQGGGLYDKSGQRMAAIAIDGGVYFVDHSRNIDGFIPDCGLNKDAVMGWYHRSMYDHMPPCLNWHTDGGSHEIASAKINAWQALRARLTEAAKCVPPL